MLPPDTDVFILAIHRYHQLCRKTYFVTGVGNKKRVSVISPGLIVNALGDENAEASPGSHAFSGADITGRFAGKGKLTCWQAFSTCSMDVVSAFAALRTSEKLEADDVVSFIRNDYCRPTGGSHTNRTSIAHSIRSAVHRKLRTIYFYESTLDDLAVCHSSRLFQQVGLRLHTDGKATMSEITFVCSFRCRTHHQDLPSVGGYLNVVEQQQENNNSQHVDSQFFRHCVQLPLLMTVQVPAHPATTA